ncbi:MAG TPA: carboxypeptidase-like regulatory domain-containing protein [Bryobacteraceae bacterium]|nr:carboxypeptidase-like regulatory domain-containing protein [Bryobacteraceae bacterium]
MIPILIAAGLLFFQQAAAPSRPGVAGRVVNSLSGEAVQGATVILRSRDETNGISYADETDADGRFSMQDVQPGEYSISVRRQGFAFEPPGATGAPAPNLKVEPGGGRQEQIIRLTPLGVIAGRVLDSDGDPLHGVMVDALAYGYAGGKRTQRSVGQAQTNVNGEFRLFGLRAGTYYLQATGERRFSPFGVTRGAGSPTYYPSAGDADSAGAVELRAGAELDGIDIRMLATAARYTVRFKLPSSDIGNYRPMIFRHGGGGGGFNLSFVDGMFIAENLEPGVYDVVVARGENGKQSYARQTVTVVDADIDGGPLTFSPATNVTGAVRVEGGAFHDLSSLRLMLRAARAASFMGTISAGVKADGSFRFEQAVPDVYDVEVQSREVYVKAVRVGDQELKDRQVDLTELAGPLTVVLGADVGEVEGEVKNAAGQLVVRARVNLIAYGAHLGRNDLNRFAFTDEKGEFKVKNVAPGDYQVFAWENVPVGAPQDPEFRKRFEKQAVPLTMQSNGHEKVSVTAISAAQVDRSSQ